MDSNTNTQKDHSMNSFSAEAIAAEWDILTKGILSHLDPKLVSEARILVRDMGDYPAVDSAELAPTVC